MMRKRLGQCDGKRLAEDHAFLAKILVRSRLDHCRTLAPSLRAGQRNGAALTLLKPSVTIRGAREDAMSDGGGVRRIEFTERETPVFGGAVFGSVGSYERLHGIAYCELDPTHALNTCIVNLDKAPRNARGYE